MSRIVMLFTKILTNQSPANKKRVYNVWPKNPGVYNVWQISCLQTAGDKIWDHMTKTGFWGQKRRFRAQKEKHCLVLTMFWPRPGKVVQTKKYPLPKYQIYISPLANFGCFFGKNRFLAKKPLFGQT